MGFPVSHDAPERPQGGAATLPIVGERPNPALDLSGSAVGSNDAALSGNQPPQPLVTQRLNTRNRASG